MSATVHDFARRARDADRPEVRAAAEAILRRKLEATGFHWTDAGGGDDLAGIDVWVRLPNTKQVGVDVKNNTWGEVRLEYVSRTGEGKPGWTVDDRKRTDYVLNLWPKRFWLIDFPSLKAVAKEHRERYLRVWGNGGAEMVASSTGSGGASWKTQFVPVPVGILLADIYGQTVMGTPLSRPRPCPACHEQHPAGVTCRDGNWPWEAQVIVPEQAALDQVSDLDDLPF